MNSNEVFSRDQRAFCYLGRIPQRLLELREADHVTEYLMYDLCNEHCFNLDKAAYFVDNPDFDCLKGVAGYSKTEAQSFAPQAWKSPENLKSALERSVFNNKVRGMMQCSTKKNAHIGPDVAHAIGTQLGMKQPQFCTWDMKHDNHGLFVYESADAASMPSQECVLSGVCLLSFCPIY